MTDKEYQLFYEAVYNGIMNYVEKHGTEGLDWFSIRTQTLENKNKA